MSNRIGWTNRASIASSLRPAVLAVCVGSLFAFVTSGSASVDTDIKGAEAAIEIDIFIVATDRETADELLGRLQDVENVPALKVGDRSWSRGHLTSMRDGSVYSVVVGKVEAPGDTTTETIMQHASKVWRPRYVLVLGMAPAVAYDEPLGAVGVVTMVCGFDLDRYEKSQDAGKCHRPDGGLLTAALSIASEWGAAREETAAEKKTGRAGCSPARVVKLMALSGTQELGPGFVEAATKLSEDLHRGLLMERDGISLARAVQRIRYERRSPIGMLMIRGIYEVRVPGAWRKARAEAGEPKQRRLQKACAARDTVDFALELIRNRWPVSPKPLDP